MPVHAHPITHLAHPFRGGAANKNIGDAFLLVWKLPKGIRSRELASLSAAAAAEAGAAGAGAGGWRGRAGGAGEPWEGGSPAFPSAPGDGGPLVSRCSSLGSRWPTAASVARW